MKAFVNTTYGGPEILRLQDVDPPVLRDELVLIRVRAVSINGSDLEGLYGRPLYARMGGLRRPGNPILGSDIAGYVEAVGGDITRFKPGDEVFGELPEYHGGFAEYACAPEKTLAIKPAGLSFEQAAAIPQGGTIAYNGICTTGKVQAGQRVLINGAGGSAGVFAVQLARLAGAEITAVDNAYKMDFIRTLGVDRVIDYAREDFAREKDRYDLILDLVAQRSAFASARALRRGGTYSFVGGSAATLFQVLLFGPSIRRRTGKRLRLLVVGQNPADLLAITELCTAGKLAPVIDRVYPFAEIPEAMRYVVEGRARGKVVINYLPSA